MIKKFIDKLLGKSAGTASGAKSRFGKRSEVPASVHGIDPALVDERARNVVTTLQDAGYEAYVVGGAVRDLLLGLRPKDFDVATNATPEQVKSLFRRAFIIGRRFRIVHVVYGRGREHEVIEVSTFRAYMDNAAAEQVKGNERTSKGELAGMTHAVDSSGRVLRDNVWGPQEEDAARRDFTVNAMYYDPASQIVVDYHNGIKDAKKLVLRMIGDPVTRYREDPVRIIRAIRFSAKLAALGFEIEPKTAAPLIESSRLLADVPQSRLFDEMLKLLQTGHAIATIAQLRKLGLSKGIYPLLDVVVERADQPFVNAALADTDRRVGEGKPVAPSFLLACVLWADVRDGWATRMEGRHGQRAQQPFPALQDAIDEVFDSRIGDVSGRGKLAADMREIWMMQPRFDKRTGSTPYSLIDQARFRAAFDFMRLRADVGEVSEAIAEWWQEFSTADDLRRQDLLDQVRDELKIQARTRVRLRESAPAATRARTDKAPLPRAPREDRGERDERPAQAQAQAPFEDADAQDDAAPAAFIADGDAATAPRKRRRRRNKPRTEGGGGEGASEA
ncbi:polynucleotide adenylyltransferase PcnB [Variovorax ginsengisoli]|uniref:Poly(A) polymerase I n=1 Tax=Variovorax ginsengisoli TaxID=363844 RepID=A0ABT9S146_9BURK|nr:polynucleotide adenylyltransferase PcnB [Variovorax ginsengisoli]MDP9898079.1 poly(A) polymerase [Variovorax ginsengisoli]